MLRDYLTPGLPTIAIGLLSVTLGSDTFASLYAQFDHRPNGILAALLLALALRVSFFLFADGLMRLGTAWWLRGFCLIAVLLAASASAANGVLPGSTFSPVERAILDALILGLVGLKNAQIAFASANDGGPGGSRGPPDGQGGPINILELLGVLDRHVVEEYGGVFLYAPQPEPPDQPRLQPWILLLQARKVIKNDPWVVYPDAIRAKVRANHPHLFVVEPAKVHIYRLDKKALADLMATL